MNWQILAYLLLLVGIASRVEAFDRPNVVVVMTDDQGWGDLSVHGNQNLQTPNIDSLAKSGASFDRFFVCPVCSPTRCEFLTGRYHPRANVYSTSTGGERMDLEEVTIADSFKAAGYRTAAFGKWHNGTQLQYHPNARGFQEFYGFCSGHWGNYWSPMLDHNGEIVQGNGFLTDDLTDHAIEFLQSQSDAPFFVYLALNTPHSPMQVPDSFWEKFESADLKMPGPNPKTEDVRHTRAALAMCENIDWNIGRLLKALDTAKLSDNTIVLFLSDNGPNGARWNGEMKGIKGSTDEGGVRSPLFMRWPAKIKPGLQINQIAAAIDLYPTLTQLCQVLPQNNLPVDGLSLAPLLLDKQSSWPDRILFSKWGKNVSARDQHFRLDATGKLFDMVNDPGQSKDVALQHPAVADKMMKAVGDFRSTVIGPLHPDDRLFPISHPDFDIVQLPARDAIYKGGLKRSSVHPNSSYFTNWKSTEDQITWNAEALADGVYEAEIFFSCPEGQQGSNVELTFQQSTLAASISKPTPIRMIGEDQDRSPRTESYEQDWQRLKLGTLKIKKGQGDLTLQATKIANQQVMDFRLLVLRRKR